ncbi:MAG: DUF2281 domain-containing protein [Spirochaetota bacterium]
MERQQVIDKTIQYLKILPENKVKEALDYIEYLYNKNEDSILTEGMMRLSAESGSFDFLEDEEELYTYDNIKEPAE